MSKPIHPKVALDKIRDVESKGDQFEMRCYFVACNNLLVYLRRIFYNSVSMSFMDRSKSWGRADYNGRLKENMELYEKADYEMEYLSKTPDFEDLMRRSEMFYKKDLENDRKYYKEAIDDDPYRKVRIRLF